MGFFSQLGKMLGGGGHPQGANAQWTNLANLGGEFGGTPGGDYGDPKGGDPSKSSLSRWLSAAQQTGIDPQQQQQTPPMQFQPMPYFNPAEQFRPIQPMAPGQVSPLSYYTQYGR